LLETERERARRHDELVIDTGHDITRALRALLAQIDVVRDAGASMATDAVERIVADLIALSTMRLGRVRIEAIPEDGARLARAALDEVTPFINVAIVLEAGEAIVPIATDGPAAVRILSAIVVHALQTTVRGEARLSVCQEEGEAGGDVVWTLSVKGFGLEQTSDEGGKASSEKSYAGSALDLALANARAAMLGGSIAMASEPGLARTFTLRLPSRPPSRR
jgi:signal transduction histidine kinase